MMSVFHTHFLFSGLCHWSCLFALSAALGEGLWFVSEVAGWGDYFAGYGRAEAIEVISWVVGGAEPATPALSYLILPQSPLLNRFQNRSQVPILIDVFLFDKT